jgi:N-acetylmuramoyl-L-alanine amidase
MSGYTAGPFGDGANVVPVYKDGLRVLDGVLLNDTTYVSLRDFIDLIDKEMQIEWDSETATASVQTDGLDLAVTVGTKYIAANGRYLYTTEEIINYNGSVVVPIRPLSLAFNAVVDWEVETHSTTLTTDELEYIESGDEFYNEDDLYWLSRLISAESGNQTIDGKIAVGNVVLNRVLDPTCPNTVKEVIFDDKYGVQFSVTENGTINDEPNEESILAAKICLEGYNLVEDCIYFVNPEIGISSWFYKNHDFVTSIDDHDFYA